RTNGIRSGAYSFCDRNIGVKAGRRNGKRVIIEADKAGKRHGAALHNGTVAQCDAFVRENRTFEISAGPHDHRIADLPENIGRTRTLAHTDHSIGGSGEASLHLKNIDTGRVALRIERKRIAKCGIAVETINSWR